MLSYYENIVISTSLSQNPSPIVRNGIIVEFGVTNDTKMIADLCRGGVLSFGTMVLTLYYLESSPPARSVDLLIHTLGLTVQYKALDFSKQEQLNPEFVKINPLHTVPTIDDDGFVLCESRAIMTYLVSKYGKDDSLYPKDLQKRAIVDQRLHYSNDVFYVRKEATIPLLYSNIKSVSEGNLAKIREVQENVEKLLEDNKFMAGDSLTVADFSYITLMDALEVYSPTGNRFPATKSWSNNCKTVMKDFEKVNKKGADYVIDVIKEALSS